jgi:hypothetical protein
MGGLASVWRYKMPFADPNAMLSRVVKSNGSFADAAVHQNIKRKKDVTFKLFFGLSSCLYNLNWMLNLSAF